MKLDAAVPDRLRDHTTEKAAVGEDTLPLVPEGPTAAESAGRVAHDLDDLFSTARRRTQGGEKPLATPWITVNKALGDGLWPGMYCLVGGTGVGKTQWAVQLAVHAACAGSVVLYLALELSRRDLAARIVGDVARVPWSDLLYGRLSEAGVQKVIDQSKEVVRALPLHIECASPYGYGVEALAARAQALRPGLVVIDYLQVCGGRAGEEPRSLVGHVSYVARGLARDLDAVVLVLSSTARSNYEVVSKGGKRPPSDFVGLGKESGEIEYAADGVFVLTRAAGSSNECELVVAKHRHAGPKGNAKLRWTGTSFDSPATTRPKS